MFFSLYHFAFLFSFLIIFIIFVNCCFVVLFSFFFFHKISLIATIKKYRPDLLVQREVTESPIQETIPTHLLEQFKQEEIEGVGLPMTAGFLTGVNTNPQNWCAYSLLFLSFPLFSSFLSLSSFFTLFFLFLLFLLFSFFFSFLKRN